MLPFRVRDSRTSTHKCICTDLLYIILYIPSNRAAIVMNLFLCFLLKLRVLIYAPADYMDIKDIICTAPKYTTDLQIPSPVV